MRRFAIAAALLLPPLVLWAAPWSAAQPPAGGVEELKREQARLRHLADLKASAQALALVGPTDVGVGLAAALLVERHRTDQYTVYLIKSGGSYHKSARCQTL